MTINQRKHVPMRRGSLFLKHPICCKYKEGVSLNDDTPSLSKFKSYLRNYCLFLS